MPAFYNRPKQIDELVIHTLARVLDRLGLPHTLVPNGKARRRPSASASDPERAVGVGLLVTTGSPELSIVVPVYNEEESLPLLWPEIRRCLIPPVSRTR
jgi:hypothetical protein